MKGTLAMLETTRAAHPEGLHPVETPRPVAFADLPTIGERWLCFPSDNDYPAPFPLTTGTVRGLRRDGATLYFRTRRSTYELRIDEETTPCGST